MITRLSIAVILFIFYINASAQNVGIGITNPLEALHIKKDQDALTSLIIENTQSTANSATRIAFVNGQGNLAGIHVSDVLSAPSNVMRFYNNRSGGHFRFVTNNTQRLYIGSDGKVAIGNFNNPSGVLHIKGSEWGLNPVIIEGDVSANNVGPTLRFTNASHEYEIIGSTGAGAAIGANHFAIYDNTASGYRLVISPDGNVGIGTTFPLFDAKLQVQTSSELAAADIQNIYSGNIHRFGLYVQSVNNPGYGYGIRSEGGYMAGQFESRAAGHTGQTYGIYSFASGGAINWAGYFNGNVHVTGTLSKAAGTFRIDHPVDPENKILSHSFVESPDMMNVYAGVATTGSNGEGIAELPSYFQKLNINYTYHLTVMGGVFAQAIVFKEIESNRFIIKTNQPNVKVSWLVTGVRNDPYAQKNRVVPEEDKKENRGKYLNPEVYGLPMEKSIAPPPAGKQ
jgi:hypothetical protein